MFTCPITKREVQDRCSLQLKEIKRIDHKAICGQCDYYRKVIVGKQKIEHQEKKEKAKPIFIKDISIATRFPPDSNDIKYFEFQNWPDLYNQVRQHLRECQAYVAEFDIEVNTFILLQMKQMSFEKTKNPIYALEAFLLTRDAGLYPPFWALEWLLKGFEEYHKSNGRKPIDEFLGFTGRSFKKLIEEDRDSWSMETIWRLNRFCGYDVKSASKSVSQHFKNNPEWNKTGLKIRTPEGSTLATKYSAGGWGHIFDSLYEKHMKEIEEKFRDKKWKRNFLNIFKKADYLKTTV